VAEPKLGGKSVVNILISVLLPAPLGPIRPKILLRSIAKVT